MRDTKNTQLLIYGYHRKVSAEEIQSLIEFLLQRDKKKEQNSNELLRLEQKNELNIKVFQERDRHGCYAAFCEILGEEMHAREFEEFLLRSRSLLFENVPIHLMRFSDVELRPKALEGLPRTIGEVFGVREVVERCPKGYSQQRERREEEKEEEEEERKYGDEMIDYNNNDSAAQKRKRGSDGYDFVGLSRQKRNASNEKSATATTTTTKLICANAPQKAGIHSVFEGVEYFEFDVDSANPGDFKQEGVRIKKRSDSKFQANLENKNAAVIYAGAAMQFFIGAKGLAVARMRRTYPSVGFECLDYPQKIICLWTKSEQNKRRDAEVRKCEEILLEKALQESIETLQRTSEEFNLSAKKPNFKNNNNFNSYYSPFQKKESSSDQTFNTGQQQCVLFGDNNKQTFSSNENENDAVITAVADDVCVDFGKTPIPPTMRTHSNNNNEEDMDEDDDDFGGVGNEGEDEYFYGGAENNDTTNYDAQEELEDADANINNIANKRRTPSPGLDEHEDEQYADDHSTYDINSELATFKAISERRVSRTDLSSKLNSIAFENVAERCSDIDRFVRVRLPKNKGMVEGSNYACGFVLSAFGEAGRTKLHEVTWKVEVDLGTDSTVYTTNVAYLSNENFKQIETSAFTENLKRRDGEDSARLCVFGRGNTVDRNI